MSDDAPEWAQNKARRLLADDPALSRAMDILLADGVPDERCAQIVLAARANGDDVEAIARHIVNLRSAFRAAGRK